MIERDQKISYGNQVIFGSRFFETVFFLESISNGQIPENKTREFDLSMDSGIPTSTQYLGVKIDGSSIHSILRNIKGRYPYLGEVLFQDNERTFEGLCFVIVKPGQKNVYTLDINTPLLPNEELVISTQLETRFVRNHLDAYRYYGGLPFQQSINQFQKLLKLTYNSIVNYLDGSSEFKLKISKKQFVDTISTPNSYFQSIVDTNNSLEGRFDVSHHSFHDLRLSIENWDCIDDENVPSLIIDGDLLVQIAGPKQWERIPYVKLSHLVKKIQPDNFNFDNYQIKMNCKIKFNFDLTNHILVIKQEINSVEDGLFEFFINTFINHHLKLKTLEFDPTSDHSSFAFRNFVVPNIRIMAEELIKLSPNLLECYYKQFTQVLSLQVIPNQVDDIQNQVHIFSSSFKEIKEIQGIPLFDRLSQMEKSLSDLINKDIIERYDNEFIKKEINSHFPLFPKLSSKSKRFIEVAFTINSISGLPDYSPVLLGLSKAVESEVELLFSSFRDHLLLNKSETILFNELDNEYLKLSNSKQRSTGSLYKYLKYEGHLELGSMVMILNQAVGKTSENVPTFGLFKKYIENNYGADFIHAMEDKENSIGNDIDIVRLKCRNGAAHTDIITKLEVEERFQIVIGTINRLAEISKK